MSRKRRLKAKNAKWRFEVYIRDGRGHGPRETYFEPNKTISCMKKLENCFVKAIHYESGLWIYLDRVKDLQEFSNSVIAKSGLYRDRRQNKS